MSRSTSDAKPVAPNNELGYQCQGTMPTGDLSNFAPHAFAIDGVTCGSMEGFLQSLKIWDAAEQERVCALIGPMPQKTGRLFTLLIGMINFLLTLFVTAASPLVIDPGSWRCAAMDRVQMQFVAPPKYLLA